MKVTNLFAGTPSWRSLISTAILLASIVKTAAQPVIMEQPKNRLGLEVGSEASFTVQAVGTDELEYQWRLNGVNIPGATLATFDIRNVQLADCGTYSVAIADSKGAINSEPALLLPNIVAVDPKDFFQDRFEIGERNEFDRRSGFLRSHNRNATKEPGEPDHAEKKGTNSIWFRWMAPESGIVRFSVRGSGFDTLMAAYTGQTVDKLEPVSKSAQDDDGGAFSTSEINFNVVKGTDYAIAVDGYEGAQGNIILQWNFDETFERLPEIFFMPTNRTVQIDDQVVLNVDFEGQTGRWFHNGQPTENTGKTFIIDKVDESIVGRYSVVISDGERRFVRTVPADIQINISDDKIDLGAFAHDKFMASSEGNRVEQPRKTPPIAASSGPARGYTTTQVFSTVGATKDPGEPNHAGVIGGASEWYTYVAPANGTMHINTEGSTYDTVLAVYTGPGFDFDTLVCVASNNVAGVAGNDRVRFAATSGVIYYIAVDGVGGASGTVHLNINLGDAPSISVPPASQTVGVGTNAVFSVTASGTTPMRYQWLFNGVNIANATNSSYTRIAAQTTHAGNYRVVVSNAINVVTSSVATLTVLTKPAITAQPTHVTASPGANVSFTVTATGSPTLRYQWRDDGVTIANATNATLNLTNVQASHAGNYTVVITNTVGSVTSNPATLTVNSAPAISSPPSGRTVGAGQSITLTVVATGTPAPSYQWRLNGSPIANATNSSYPIPSFQAIHEGTYRVVVSNALGSATSAAAILALNTPRVSATTITNGSFRMSFVGVTNTAYILQATTNFTSWDSLSTNSSANGFLTLLDTNVVGWPLRFYRVVSQ